MTVLSFSTHQLVGNQGLRQLLHQASVTPLSYNEVLRLVRLSVNQTQGRIDDILNHVYEIDGEFHLVMTVKTADLMDADLVTLSDKFFENLVEGSQYEPTAFVNVSVKFV